LALAVVDAETATQTADRVRRRRELVTGMRRGALHDRARRAQSDVGRAFAETVMVPDTVVPVGDLGNELLDDEMAVAARTRVTSSRSSAKSSVQ